MAKMFEDAFRSLGILKDDDPKCVARSILEVVVERAPKGAKSDAASRAKSNAQDKDWLEITIKPYDQSR